MTIRDKAVYATQRLPLKNQVDDLIKAADEPEPLEGDLMALIVPDSNRLAGGPIAARVYQHLRGRAYDTVIVISPSHTGTFRRMNICSIDTYVTPLGDLTVNDRVRNELCDEDDDIFLDDEGHYHTEGVDVQLPFLQALMEDFDIVPIVMGEETPEFCRELGHAVGEVMYNRKTLVIATVDLMAGTEEALEQFKACFEARNVSRLMALLNSETVHMEGKGALLVALIAALHRRATDARILDLKPPQEDAPGYVGAVVWRR